MCYVPHSTLCLCETNVNMYVVTNYILDSLFLTCVRAWHIYVHQTQFYSLIIDKLSCSKLSEVLCFGELFSQTPLLSSVIDMLVILKKYTVCNLVNL